MGKQVTVTNGTVMLPSAHGVHRYKQGDTVVLTNEEYAGLSAVMLAQLSSATDVAGPSRPTTPDKAAQHGRFTSNNLATAASATLVTPNWVPDESGYPGSTDLLDLTNPLAPVVKKEAMISLLMTWWGANAQAGKFLKWGFDVDLNGIDVSADNSLDLGFASARSSLSVRCPVPAGAVLDAYATHNVGAPYGLTFRAFVLIEPV